MLAFVTDFHTNSPVIVCYMVNDLLCEVVYIDYDMVATVVLQTVDDDVNQWLSPTRTRALGVWSVSGRSRVPRPAAKSMACICILLSCVL